MRLAFFLWIYAVVCGFGSTESPNSVLRPVSDVEVKIEEISDRYHTEVSITQNILEDHSLEIKDNESTERWGRTNSKPIRQKRKKHHLQKDMENPKQTHSRRSKMYRKKNRNRNVQNDGVLTIVHTENPGLEIDSSTSSTSSGIYTGLKLKKRKSKKYGQTRRKMQLVEPTAKSKFGSPSESSSTNSNIQRNPLNQVDSASEITQQIKVSPGRRREKLRFRNKDKEHRFAEKMEKRRLLQEKRAQKRRRKLERLERKRQNAESQQRRRKKDQKTINKTLPAGDSMAPPSIDYFVENYVDTNDAPPFEVIAVSLESQSKDVTKETLSDSVEAGLDQVAKVTDESEKSVVEGDLSCLEDNFQPAPKIPHADVKYLRNDEQEGGSPFLEVEYICHRGYKMQFNDSSKRRNIYCKSGQWMGKPPTCARTKDLVDLNETCSRQAKCDQLCYIRNGVEKCSCHRGFRMKDNRCTDINECTSRTSICEFGCINTIGSYKCKCPKGLRVSDNNNCIDINECLLRNGHGPCQDICTNTWGSYKCSCDNLPGSQLSSDGHSCVDIDECSVNNGGCSHTCLNTMGRAFCLCPEGWTLDKDWKTCVDIDECAEPKTENSEQRCEFGCINTPGSYSCLVDIGADQPIDDDLPSCPEGFTKNATLEDCQDVNECTENNGGCSHICINTIGSFHCACQPGFVFSSDQYSCVVINSSTDISCPPLFPPKHGYLECSRPIASDIIGTDANGFGGRRRITNRPGSQCVLRCPTGFRINGNFSKQCSSNGIWVGEGNGTCIRYPMPKLICPADIALETPPDEAMAKLRIPRPKTDVNYERDVSISPDWMRNTEIALEVGVRNVTYTARHPVSKLSVSCTFTITVLVGEPPTVKFCPSTQKYSLNKQYESIKISWKEPVFWDNVNVTEISRTNSPGNSFGVGSHQIVYAARDHAGYSARCVFKILVNVPLKPSLNHPLPIYHMFYK